MRTRKLGPLTVSVVGLGCNNFGGRIDEAATRAVVDAALDAGVTFFDTADIYGNQGGSEELLGRAPAGPPRRGRARHEVRQGDGGRRASVAARGLHPGGARRVAARASRPTCVDLYQHHEEDTEHAARGDDRRARRARRGREDPRVRHLELPRRRRWSARGRLASAAYVSEQSEYSWLRRDAEADVIPGLRAARARLHPVLPARERPAHRQGVARCPAGCRARACTGGRSTTPTSTASSACAPGRRRTASRCSTSPSAGWLPCRRSCR